MGIEDGARPSIDPIIAQGWRSVLFLHGTSTSCVILASNRAADFLRAVQGRLIHAAIPPTSSSQMASHPMTVNAFVTSEVELYEADGHNRLVAAAASAIRCEEYLDEIERRYTIAAGAHAQMLQEFMSH